MIAKLLGVATVLAILIPARASVGAVTIHVHALVLICELTAAAAGLAFAFRRSGRPHHSWRWS